MSPRDLPQFSVISTQNGASSGRFDPSPAMGQIREQWIACLYQGDGQFLWGRFVLVDQAQNTCDFLPDDPTTAGLLRPGQSYPYLDSYWGQRAELVLDATRTWREAEFQPYDTTPIGGELIPGGWDHEHCSICWETIGPNDQPVGYVSGVRDWVCGECHRCFVVPKSIAFVTWGTGDEPPRGS